MALIADILLVAGALGAAVYCLVLSKRLQRFTRLESGVGGAIAVLSAQVDDMTRALREARAAAHSSEAALAAQTARAEQATERLSLMLASMHDLPLPQAPVASGAAAHEAGTPAGAYAEGAAAASDAAQPGRLAPCRAHAGTAPQRRPSQADGAEAAPHASTPLHEEAESATSHHEDESERRPRFLRRRTPLRPAPVPEAAE